MDGVVSHRQRDGALRLGLNMHLCVCGVCVVVLGLDDVLLVQSRVDRHRPDSGGKKNKNTNKQKQTIHLTSA